MQKYKVIREHVGDRHYNVGDEREANENDVAHLIGRCLVKAEKPVENKAAKPLKNKSAK